MAENMNHWERVRAAIKGEDVDRVPVSLWRHWPVEDETAQGLANALPGIPMVFVDETYTTSDASEKLREAGRKSHQQKHLIDQAAAVEILNRWMGETELGSSSPSLTTAAPSSAGNPRRAATPSRISCTKRFKLSQNNLSACKVPAAPTPASTPSARSPISMRRTALR